MTVMESICPFTVGIDTGMSNFDHTIDEGFADDLREREVYGRYAGWNFNGLVWFDRERQEFACEVWHYKVPQEDVFYAATLEEIMDDVSAEWGSE